MAINRTGPASRLAVIQIRQRYPGHARQVLHAAAEATLGRYKDRLARGAAWLWPPALA